MCGSCLRAVTVAVPRTGLRLIPFLLFAAAGYGQISGFQIPPFTPPNGCVGAAYSYTLSSTGGTPPITWSIGLTQAPPGLSITPDGFLKGTPTAAGSFTFQVRATDARQAVATQNATITILASCTTPITIQTIPAGLPFSVDGGSEQKSPATVSLSQGSHTVGVRSPQSGGTGIQYVFVSWSDGGAASHTITVGASPITLTATFKTQFQLTTAASPAGGGSVTPASGAFFDSGTVVPISATPGSGFTFSGWNGPVANQTAASTTVTMSAPQTVSANFTGQTSFQTSPPGLKISVDGGTAQPAPFSLSLTPGTHTVSTSSPQAGTASGTQYVFSSWSDGGAATHSITVGTAPATYTASFKTQYQLTTSVLPAGSGTVTPGSGGFFDSGSSVAISAAPATGYSFSNWTGSVANTNSSSTTISMTAPQTATANFIRSGTAITIQTVPSALQFTVDGGTPQTAPQTLTLTPGTHSIGVATAQAGLPGVQYVYTSWSDGGLPVHSITVTSTPAAYTANFQTQYQLNTAAAPAGGGSVTPSGGNYYNAGTLVSLVATPAATYSFQNWTGNVSNPNSQASTIFMSAPQAVTANFVRSAVTVTIATTPPGLQVVVDGSTVTSPFNLSGSPGANHTINAPSPQGSGSARSVFDTWSDGGGQSHSITIPATSATVTATFKTQYLLSISVSPPEGGLVTPPGGSYYDLGQTVTVTATPNAGFTFANWTGPVASATSVSTTVVMTAAQTIAANFKAGGVTGDTPIALPPGFVGVVYQAIALTGTGGTSPYRWTASSLPPGLTLSSGGVLSGTPSTSGNFSLTATFTDSSTPAQSFTRSYTLQVTQPSTLMSVDKSDITFAFVQGDPDPMSKSFSVLSIPASVAFSAAVSTADGGNWLSIPAAFVKTGPTPASVSVSVHPAGLAPNTYTGQITLIAPNATPSTKVISVTLTVMAASPPALNITPSLQSFTTPQNGDAQQGQITVTNTGGGTLQFAAQATSDANWLSVATGSGSATAALPASLQFTIKPSSSVGPGLHSGAIDLKDVRTGASQTAVIKLLVNTAQQSIQLSQTGLTFSAVANGPAVPSQNLSVLNLGQGTMNWTATAQPRVAGQTWLKVTPAGGQSTPAAPGDVRIQVDQTGLPAGQYYGVVQIASSTAANNPQSISVLLNVVAAGQLGTAPTVSTAGILLPADAGSSTPSQQDVQLFNPAGTSVTFSATAFTSDGGAWLKVTPASGSLSGTGAGSITIQANPSGLSAQLYSGTVQVAFGDGTVHSIDVDLVIPSAAATASDRHGEMPLAVTAAGCSPTQLVPVFQSPERSQNVVIPQAQTLRVLIQDDCHGALAKAAGGAAQVTFSNQDQAVDLVDRGGGIWEGTWIPAAARSQVTVLVLARRAATALATVAGAASIQVQVLPASTNAAPQALGAVNAASLDKQSAGIVVPGGYVSIYGARLADDGTALAGNAPLPIDLLNTRLLLGSQPLPLYFASPGQVNGLIPQALAVNTDHQLVIQRGDTVSTPVAVSVTDLQPGIFTQDLTGGGQGSILIAGSGLLAAPAGTGSRPVKRGEYVEIYATGLGAVRTDDGTPPPADGAAAPDSSSPQFRVFSTARPVTVSIGDVDAPVTFAGLSPGYVALYQVNVLVPLDAPTGDAIKVVLTITNASGQPISSRPVTIAVQ